MISSTVATARAKALYAQAEEAEHPRDRAALKSAAAAWERIARPAEPWSLKGERRDLQELRRDTANATGPFQPPKPPQAPTPQSVKPDIHSAESVRETFQKRYPAAARPSTIEF